MSAVTANFGAYALQSPAEGRTFTDTDVDNPPENRIQAETLAEADGALTVKQQFQPKPFFGQGIVRKSSLVEMKNARDELIRALYQKNQAFDIDFGDGVRRYLANIKSLVIARRQTSFVYTANFLCADGMGWDLGTTTLLDDLSTTTSSEQFPVTAEGTYQVEPLIRVVVNTVTGSGALTMTISNGTTLRGLTITRTGWTPSDVVEIDSLNKTVYVNNVATAFTGQFPRWDVGAGVVSYLDDFTTRDVAIQISYTRRWL